MSSLPSARDVATYSDEQLTAFLEAHGPIVKLQDPENVAEDLIQRLRERAQGFYEPAKTQTIDLNEVTARLHAISEPIERTPPVSSPPSTPPLPSQEEQTSETLRAETTAYPALLAAGGRPPYPLHLLSDFVYHPETYLQHAQYHNIIMFWRRHDLYTAERTAFCAGMLSRWEVFCRLQQIIRERDVESERTLLDAAAWDTWEAFTERYGPKNGAWGFDAYTDTVKRRLSRFGIMRSLDLKRDLSQQTAMTTWLEYLAYEYEYFDDRARFAKMLRRKYDEAWKMLVCSGVLAPKETVEGIHSRESILDRIADSERTQRKLRSAELNLAAAEAAVHAPAASLPADAGGVTNAKTTFDTAEREYKQVMRRNDIITEYIEQVRPYRRARKEAEHQDHLLQWIKLQVPLIESETGPLAHLPLALSPGSAAQPKDHDDKGPGKGTMREAQHKAIKRYSYVTSSAKRKRSSNDAFDSGPSVKRSKPTDHNARDLFTADAVAAAIASGTNAGPNARKKNAEELTTIGGLAPNTLQPLKMHHEAKESVPRRRSTRLATIARNSQNMAKSAQALKSMKPQTSQHRIAKRSGSSRQRRPPSPPSSLRHL